MASQMIETIVAWGYPPNFPLSNQNTDALKNRMSFLNRTQDNNIVYDLYTMFFTSIANIIETNVKDHHEIIFQDFYKPHEYVTKKSWPLPKTFRQPKHQGGVTKQKSNTLLYYPSIEKFSIRLPFKRNNSNEIEALAIKEYFQAILTENIPLKEFFFMQSYDSTMTTQQSNVMRVQHPKLKSVQNQVINYSQDDEEDNNDKEDESSSIDAEEEEEATNTTPHSK
jgi:hypothetical protein